jgi:GNAT superfamily N-acetyltransferase
MARPAFIVRPASTNDLPVLGRLGALLMRTHYAFDPERFMAPGVHAEEEYAAFLRSELEHHDVAIYVATQRDAVIGYVYAAIEPRSWKELREAAGFVHDLVVDEGQRGAGVATALLDGAVTWLAERGVPRVVLWTAPQNPAARMFARLGFRSTMIEMTREL